MMAQRLLNENLNKNKSIRTLLSPVSFYVLKLNMSEMEILMHEKICTHISLLKVMIFKVYHLILRPPEVSDRGTYLCLNKSYKVLLAVSDPWLSRVGTSGSSGR